MSVYVNVNGVNHLVHKSLHDHILSLTRDLAATKAERDRLREGDDEVSYVDQEAMVPKLLKELEAARRVVEAAREVRYRSRSGTDVRIDLDAFTGLWDKIEDYDAVVKETTK